MKHRLILVLSLLTLAGCTSGPNMGVGIGLGGGDVSVRPSVSGSVGGIGVSIWG